MVANLALPRAARPTAAGPNVVFAKTSGDPAAVARARRGGDQAPTAPRSRTSASQTAQTVSSITTVDLTGHQPHRGGLRDRCSRPRAMALFVALGARRAPRSEFATMAALGAPLREIAAFLWSEAALVLGAGLVLAAGLGWLLVEDARRDAPARLRPAARRARDPVGVPGRRSAAPRWSAALLATALAARGLRRAAARRDPPRALRRRQAAGRWDHEPPASARSGAAPRHRRRPAPAARARASPSPAPRVPRPRRRARRARRSARPPPGPRRGRRPGSRSSPADRRGRRHPRLAAPVAAGVLDEGLQDPLEHVLVHADPERHGRPVDHHRPPRSWPGPSARRPAAGRRGRRAAARAGGLLARRGHEGVHGARELPRAGEHRLERRAVARRVALAAQRELGLGGMPASGVRSSCESSAEKRRSWRRLAARRSSSPSSVAASWVSSSYGSPEGEAPVQVVLAPRAASVVIRATGRSAARSDPARQRPRRRAGRTARVRASRRGPPASCARTARARRRRRPRRARRAARDDRHAASRASPPATSTSRVGAAASAARPLEPRVVALRRLDQRGRRRTPRPACRAPRRRAPREPIAARDDRARPAPPAPARCGELRRVVVRLWREQRG